MKNWLLLGCVIVIFFQSMTYAAQGETDIIKPFIDAGGRVQVGTSVESRDLMTPFFIVTELNHKDQVTNPSDDGSLLLPSFDVSNSVSRKIIEDIFQRKDALIIISGNSMN